MIKMPEVVSHEGIKAAEKPQASLSLVQSQATQQLGMLESGLVHASLKPIVQAKVKKVMNYVRATKDEYEHGTEDQKKAIKAKAHSLVMLGAGTRIFNEELCYALWGEATETAGELSFFYCPLLVWPSANVKETPPLEVVLGEAPSRMKAAFLSYYFWDAIVNFDAETAKWMMAPDITYYWGGYNSLKGYYDVSMTLPYVGFPEDTKISNPVAWHCDTASCIVPIKAWAGHSNYVMSSFGNGGKCSEVIIPMNLWR